MKNKNLSQRSRTLDYSSLKYKKPVDKTLMVLLSALLLFGIVMVYDATAVFSQGTFGEAYRLVVLHIIWIGFGLIGFLFFYKLDYKNIQQIAYPLFAITLFLLILLAIFGALPCSLNMIFTPCINGANRWFYLNPAPIFEIPLLGRLGFQPSELAKFSLILYLSVAISKNLHDKWMPFIITTIIGGLVFMLVLLQPNMSTATILFLIAFVLYFTSGAPLLPLLVSIPPSVFLGLLFVMSSSYRRERLLTFLNPEASGDLNLSYHINQIMIALGSGGIFGVGFGQSRQKFNYLPEVSADSIFAIVGEELGFVGTTILIIAFSVFIHRGFLIAKKAPDNLGRLLAVGITMWFASQFFVNIAAMIKLIPLTGIPLPLISYGGSSMIFSLMALGVLANISRQT